MGAVPGAVLGVDADSGRRVAIPSAYSATAAIGPASHAPVNVPNAASSSVTVSRRTDGASTSHYERSTGSSGYCAHSDHEPG